MASIIKVDDVQDAAGNNIIKEAADTITIGASGDTIALASGASQSGFGKVLQSVNVLSGALITATSNLFPEDDTIPQNTEGDEVMTLAITPVSATSKLHIFVNAFGSHSASPRQGIALFVDSVNYPCCPALRNASAVSSFFLSSNKSKSRIVWLSFLLSALMSIISFSSDSSFNFIFMLFHLLFCGNNYTFLLLLYYLIVFLSLFLFLPYNYIL